MAIRHEIRLVLTILIIFILATPAIAQDWDNIDKGLLATLIMTKTVDCLQTRWIFDNEWNELNPIIVEGVERFGKVFIPVYFALTTLGIGLIADWLPSDYRKPWLGIWVGISGKCVHRNYVVGIKFGF